MLDGYSRAIQADFDGCLLMPLKAENIPVFELH